MNLFELQSKEFSHRHIGPDENETSEMLKVIGENNLNELIDKTVPSSIRMKDELNIAGSDERIRISSAYKKYFSKK